MTRTPFTLGRCHQFMQDAARSGGVLRVATVAQLLKLALEGLHRSEPRPDAGDLLVDQPVHVTAIATRMVQQVQQPPHIRKRYVQRPAVTDEGQSLQVQGPIGAVAVGLPHRRGQQPHPLVIADGFDIHTRGLSKFSDAHRELRDIGSV